MTEKEFYVVLGEKIKGIRESCGMSRTDVAEAIAVSPSFISLVEKGEKVSAFRLNQIMNVFGLEYDFAQKKTSLTCA